MNDMRIGSTGALTTGTRTVDSFPFGVAAGDGPSAVTGAGAVFGSAMQDMFSLTTFGQHPQVFGPNEGFEINNLILMGAAGVINLYVEVTWGEVPGI
ncbi:MAG: hypothetical protein ACLQIB_01590 [Isosphaeraceae bacterium]